MYERPGGSTVSKNDLTAGEQPHMLRNSSSIHEIDNKCPEYVYLRRNSDSFLGDVADTFSPDVAGFGFCNTPLRAARNILLLRRQEVARSRKRWDGRADVVGGVNTSSIRPISVC